MNKILFPLLVLLLVGCSNSESVGVSVQPVETPSTWYNQDFADFTIQIPPGWAKAEASEGLVATYKSLPENGFVKNMNIAKVVLAKNKSSKEYAQENIETIKKAFSEYKNLAVGEVDINGEITLLHKFQARNNANANFMYFTQGYFAKEKSGYMVTCVVSESSSETDRKICSQTVESFRLK